MNKHTFPQDKKSGVLTQSGWEWEKADWKNCRCGLFHSNRDVPDVFWDKWRNMEPEPTLPDGRPKVMSHSAGVILVKGDNVWVTQAYSNCYGFIKGSYEPDNENFFQA